MADRLCAVPGRSGTAAENGLCCVHDMRCHNCGKRVIDQVVDNTCAVIGCRRAAHAQDHCKSHYNRKLTTGDVQADKPLGRGTASEDNMRRRRRSRKVCAVESCDNDAVERGWCHGHYQRWRKYGTPLGGQPLSRRKNVTCSVECCGRTAEARELCKVHYRRFLAHGDPQADKPIRTVTGKGHLSHGYWVVPVPTELRYFSAGANSIQEHRLVMAMHLGRPLRADESVHHKNGNRLDNRLENLQLWSRWQPSGQLIDDKVAWAVDFLRQYAPDRLIENALF